MIRNTNLFFSCLFFSTTVEGPTSSFECAHQLGKLCENRHLLVNLIPYNQTDVKDKLKCPSEEHMRGFLNIVSSYKTFCTIRRTMGADIASACGQLVVQKEKEAAGGAPKDIEDAVQGAKATITGKKSVKKSGSQEIVVDDEPSLERFLVPLAIATGIAAASFVITSVLFLRQRRVR
jgi:sorting nexin-8